MPVDHVIHAFGVTFVAIFIMNCVGSEKVVVSAKMLADRGRWWTVVLYVGICAVLSYGIGAAWGYGAVLVFGGAGCQ